MKIIFNDGSELVIQSVYCDCEKLLKMKVIQKTEEELKEIFQDTFKTARMEVLDGDVSKVFEGFTKLEGLTKYQDGIIEPFLAKEKQSMAELASESLKRNEILEKELEMLSQCVMELSELVYQ